MANPAGASAGQIRHQCCVGPGICGLHTGKKQGGVGRARNIDAVLAPLVGKPCTGSPDCEAPVCSRNHDLIRGDLDDCRRLNDIKVRHRAVRCASTVGNDCAVIGLITGQHVGQNQRGVSAVAEIRPITAQNLPLVNRLRRASRAEGEVGGGSEDVGLVHRLLCDYWLAEALVHSGEQQSNWEKREIGSHEKRFCMLMVTPMGLPRAG